MNTSCKYDFRPCRRNRVVPCLKSNYYRTFRGLHIEEIDTDGCTIWKKRAKRMEDGKRREWEKEGCQCVERENVGWTERGVYILSYLIRDLRLLWMRWMPLRVSCARLPRHIHSLFHFKQSTALFWVATLSPHNYHIYHFFYSFSSLSCLVYEPL